MGTTPLSLKESLILDKTGFVPFQKNDTDKLRYDLIPPGSLKELAQVLTLGAKKYGPDNWRKCKEPSRYIAAIFRHLEAYRGGELRDPESGLSHMTHIMTNAMFLKELTPTDER